MVRLFIIRVAVIFAFVSTASFNDVISTEGLDEAEDDIDAEWVKWFFIHIFLKHNYG